jgi:hypothetical protein
MPTVAHAAAIAAPVPPDDPDLSRLRQLIEQAYDKLRGKK